jgi:two-component system, sensor histidine kinase LadS
MLWKILLYLAFSSVLFSEPTSQSFPLNDSRPVNLTKDLGILETSETFSKVEIVHQDFKKSKRDTVNLGFNKKNIWIKVPLEINNENGKKFLEFRSRFLTIMKAFLYIPETNKRIDIKFPDLTIYEKLTFRYHYLELPLAYSAQTSYLFVCLDFSLPVIFQTWLYEESDVMKKKYVIGFLYGIFHGIALLVLFSSTVLFGITRDIRYLYYTALLVGLVLADSFYTGNLNILLQDYPSLENFLQRIILSWTQIFSLFLIRGSINAKLLKKKFAKYFSILLFLSYVYLFFNLVLTLHLIAILGNIMALIIGLALLYILIRASIIGDENSRWLLFSFIFLTLSVIFNVFVVFGILPQVFFISDNLKIGILFQIVVFSLLVSFRLHGTRKTLKESNQKLGQRVKERTKALGEALEKLREKEANFDVEINLAVELQRSLTPSMDKVFPLLDFRFFQESLMKIGGDFFDLFPRKDGSVAVFIADASGHGISAALLVALYKITFRNILLSDELYTPKKALEEINRQATNVLMTHNYVTVFLLIIHKDGRVQYASAGHRPAFIYRKSLDRVELLTTRGMFLGIRKERVLFEESETKIEKGDRILLYTDGLTEYKDENNKPVGSDGLFHLFARSQRGNLDLTSKAFLNRLKENQGNKHIEDDSSYLLLEYNSRSY